MRMMYLAFSKWHTYTRKTNSSAPFRSRTQDLKVYGLVLGSTPGLRLLSVSLTEKTPIFLIFIVVTFTA